MDGFVIVPPSGQDGFVELSTQSKPGHRIFEKHILNYGDLLYPGVAGGKVTIDDQFADKLIDNFNKKYCDIVQVPLAGANNEHTEDPDRNIGRVIALNKRDGKIYAQLDAADEERAKKLGKTLLGASAMMHLDYKDTKTNTKVGPTLLHVAITNRPYVTELEDFQELIAASAESSDNVEGKAVILTAEPKTKTKENPPMTLDEILAELKDGHGIDVPALQKKAADADAAVALSNKIQEELTGSGLLKLSAGGEATADDLIGAIAEAGEQIVSLSADVADLKKSVAEKDASGEVEKLVSAGRILPKDAEAMTELFLSNRDLFDKIVPEKPIVALSREAGNDEEEEADQKTVEEEIARLSAAPAAAAYIRS